MNKKSFFNLFAIAFTSLAISSLISLASCAGDKDEPVEVPNSPSLETYNYVLPDMAVNVDSQWIADTDSHIFDKNDEDDVNRRNEELEKLGVDITNHPEYSFTIPEYKRVWGKFNSTKDENIDEIVFGGEPLKDCRIVAAWVKGESTDGKISPLDFKPSQTLNIKKFESEVSLTDSGMSISYGDTRKFGNYEIGVYVVGFRNGKEARGMFYIYVSTQSLAYSMPGTPFNILQSDEGFSIRNLNISLVPELGGGQDELIVPAQGGTAILALNPVRSFSLWKIFNKEEKINLDFKGEDNYSGELFASAPDLFIESIDINPLLGIMTLKMLPNTGNKINKFDIVFKQFSNKDEPEYGRCFYEIFLYQNPIN